MGIDSKGYVTVAPLVTSKPSLYTTCAFAPDVISKAKPKRADAMKDRMFCVIVPVMINGIIIWLVQSSYFECGSWVIEHYTLNRQI
jgi:hypothetical protein